MFTHNFQFRTSMALLMMLAGAGVLGSQSAQAQGTDNPGYGVTEEGSSHRADPVASQKSDGPVRLTRFSYIKGNVTWRADESAEWSSASINLPLRQGAQIWVADGGRAELQFDDGSLVRLGTGAIVTLQTLYSDSDGEFTEIKMTDGLATMHLRHDRGIYQFDTPLASVKASGPATIRVGVGDGLELAVKSGKATVEGAQGKATLQTGDFLDLRDSGSAYTPHDLPTADSWDRWNQDRDDMIERAANQPAHQHLPANISIVANDLDEYGSWRDDANYGWVWCPRVSSSSWRPYHDGHWTWVNPFGWTWVSEEAWGWAPYHYGTWVNQSYGWAWCPGPVNQYWSPAVVHFSEYGEQVGWCPLAPSEVRYPSYLSFGFGSRNWSTYFSIGGAAVYYPTSYGYCAPRVYNTNYINRVTYINNVNNFNGRHTSYSRYAQSQEAYAANNNTVQVANNFIPLNSRNAAGVTAARTADFGGRGTYIAVAKSDTSLFVKGRAVGAPPSGKAPFAGPASVLPTPQALTPNRTFVPALQTTTNRLARPVFRAAVLSKITQNSTPISSSGVPVSTTERFTKPDVGRTRPFGVTGSDRPGQARGNSGTTGRETTGIADKPQNNVPAYTGRARTDNSQAGSFAPIVRTNSSKPTPLAKSSSASGAEAAARARESLGATNRTRRTETEVGGSGSSGERPARYNQNGPAPSGGGTREQSAPPVRTTYPPRYEPTKSGNEQRSRGTGGDYKSPEASTAPRSDPPRSEPRYSAPRSEPSRTEPRYSAPPRSEPARTPPPARETERSSPPPKGSSNTDKSSDNGSSSKGSSDSTNRGRTGRGG